MIPLMLLPSLYLHHTYASYVIFTCYMCSNMLYLHLLCHVIRHMFFRHVVCIKVLYVSYMTVSCSYASYMANSDMLYNLAIHLGHYKRFIFDGRCNKEVPRYLCNFKFVLSLRQLSAVKTANFHNYYSPRNSKE